VLPVLTEQQQAQFWKNGFVSVESVFSDVEVDALRQAAGRPAIQDALEKRRASERVVHLMPLTPLDNAFRELSRHPRLTQCAAQLIGNDIQLSNSKLATKPSTPGAGAFDWHQDFAYYTHTNYDLITISVALDDVTQDNGGMYAVEGSHQYGLLDHTRDGWMVGACIESQRWEANPELVAPMMSRAGGITIHHCLTLHGSPVNRSGNPRRLVIFQYRAGHCYQLSDHIWDDTGYQVYGTPRNVVKCVPMNVALPKNRGWERYCGEPHGSVYRQIGPIAKQWNEETRRRQSTTAND